MNTFGVSIWVEIEADDYEEAWEFADKLSCDLVMTKGNVLDSGIIDVEEKE